MPLFNFKIKIENMAGHKNAVLYKRMFGCMWTKMDEQLQMSEADYEVVEHWMDRYGIEATQLKDLTIKEKV